MLTKTDIHDLVVTFQKSKNDTGSPEVQIAILTATITYLTGHLKTHKKDVVAKRSLIKKVGQRKRLLAYLIINDFDRYKKIIEKLNLRK